jgi:hypothetical protein
MRELTGSHHEARARAMAAAMDAGCTRLEQAYIGHVASWGGECWQQDSTVQQVLLRPDGKRYHCESIARARRFMRDRGLLVSQRIYVGGKIPSERAKFRSGKGTTFNAIQWRQLAIKNPMGRAERRRRRIQLAVAERKREHESRRHELAEQARETARFAGQIGPVASQATARLTMDADLAQEIERARNAWERRPAAAVRTGLDPLRTAAAVRGPPE